MPKRLMSLREVPVDEYEGVCALLDGLAIEHYRTEPSRWGLSSGAIWVVDDHRHAEARAALDRFQYDRAAAARRERAEQLAAGTAPSLATRLRDEPLRMLALLATLAIVVALSLLPFLWLAGLLG
jgi:hypothetical protein